MNQLDFSALLAPYAGTREPDEVLVALRAGLLKKYPGEVADSALNVMFARMARGKKFDDLRQLGRYAEKECHKQTVARELAFLRVQQTNLNRALQATEGPVPWRAVVPWTLLGAVAGFVCGWMVAIQ